MNERDHRSGRLPTRAGYLGIPTSRIGGIEIIGGVFWAIGVSVVGLLLLSAIDASATDPDLDQPDGIKLAVQAFGVLGFVSAAIGMTMLANRGGFADALRRLGALGPAARFASTFFLALVIYVVAAGIVAGILQPEQEDIAENLGADKDAAAIVTVLAGVLIIGGAAIGEELFFRGMLFGGLRQRLPLWPAAAISGLLFGLPHLPQGDLAVVLQLSIFGAVLAWAYERSGTLWVPIGLHGLNNTLAFYLLVTDKI
ncbi:MAG TPA: type II CAAX endopeptidase family protein [Solirubrobacterales bacterium]|nr:type II CAAX endopeptidase family protein [Solirubrobacterales bacterium]